MWNKINLRFLGEIVLRVVNFCISVEFEVKFVVVLNGFINLLGFKII